MKEFTQLAAVQRSQNRNNCNLLQKIAIDCKQLKTAIALSVQKVLSTSDDTTRRWPMYFSIKRSLLVRPELDNAYRTAVDPSGGKGVIALTTKCQY